MVTSSLFLILSRHHVTNTSNTTNTRQTRKVLTEKQNGDGERTISWSCCVPAESVGNKGCYESDVYVSLNRDWVVLWRTCTKSEWSHYSFSFILWYSYISFLMLLFDILLKFCNITIIVYILLCNIRSFSIWTIIYMLTLAISFYDLNSGKKEKHALSGISVIFA